MHEHVVICEVCGREGPRAKSADEARLGAWSRGWNLDTINACPVCWAAGMEAMNAVACEAADIVRVRIAE